MGVAAFCTVTVTGTVAGLPIAPIVIPVPETGTGLVDVTIPLGGVLGDVVLANIPCPTVEDIQLIIGALASLTISVTEG